MSEPIKMAGKIMEIGKVDKCKRMFTEECEITYPDKIPVILGFSVNDPQNLIGNCEVIKTKDGLTAKATIYNGDVLYADKVYVGGYYNKVKMKEVDGITIVNEASLRALAVLPPEESANRNLYLEKVEYVCGFERLKPCDERCKYYQTCARKERYKNDQG